MQWKNCRLISTRVYMKFTTNEMSFKKKYSFYFHARISLYLTRNIDYCNFIFFFFFCCSGGGGATLFHGTFSSQQIFLQYFSTKKTTDYYIRNEQKMTLIRAESGSVFQFFANFGRIRNWPGLSVLVFCKTEPDPIAYRFGLAVVGRWYWFRFQFRFQTVWDINDFF